MTSRPAADECPPFFAGYVDLVPESGVLDAIGAQPDLLRGLGTRVAPERESYAYAAGKWSIRQVLGHLGDGERVFSYRALCFSRGDPTPLPGFDENAYVERSRFAATPLADLIEEFALLRAANQRMLASFTDEQWSKAGLASGKSISVRALAYVMVGHVRHHLNVLRDRYDVDVGPPPTPRAS